MTAKEALEMRYREALEQFYCESCGANPGESCVTYAGWKCQPHTSRAIQENEEWRKNHPDKAGKKATFWR